MKNKNTVIISIFIIVILLISSTYAWFIFNSDVNMAINTQIKNWTIEFKKNEQILDEKIEFKIDSIYPGMEEEKINITIENKGEIAADLSYRITAIEMFGERKSIGENYSQEELIQYINTLPFIINIKFDKEVISEEDTKANCNISFNWLLGDNQSNVITEKDKLDTQLGKKAYEFNSLPENKDIPNVRIEIQLIAKQRHT